MSSLDHFTQLLPISCSLWACVFIFYVRTFVCLCVCKYRLCKYIWWIHGRLCVCALCIYTHINLYACVLMCVCVRARVCLCVCHSLQVLVCVSTYPDYQSSACLSDHWGCLLWLPQFSAATCSNETRKKKENLLYFIFIGCSEYEVIGLHLVSYCSQEAVCVLLCVHVQKQGVWCFVLSLFSIYTCKLSCDVSGIRRHLQICSVIVNC